MAKKAQRKQRSDKGAKRGPRKALAGNGGDGRKLSKADNGKPKLGADDERVLFLHHRGAWNAWQAKVKALDKIGTDLKAALKADGFFVVDIQIADDLTGSPKQEQKVRTAVHRRLKVARWLGHPMGNQLDLFEGPQHPTVSIDRAYDHGVTVGVEGGKAEPPEHFAAGDLAQSWMMGWHAGQAAKVRGGIALLDDAGEESREASEAETADREEAGDPDGDRPSAGWGASKIPSAAQEDSGL